MRSLRVLDTHTEGEPTRIVLDDHPDLTGTLAEQRLVMKQWDWVRGVVAEPRGYDAFVGAWLRPAEGDEVAGVIYFDAAGPLGMCGHGTIGVVTALAHLGRWPESGEGHLMTPVGRITAWRHPDGSVEIENIPSRRALKDVKVTVPGYGEFTGDVAYGGNWFYILHESPVELIPANRRELLRMTSLIRDELHRQGIAGDDGGEIDHVEICVPHADPAIDVRKFVLCPSGADDRSPCGTGTSAHLACLAEDGQIAEGQVFVQESVTGGLFLATVRRTPEGWVPRIRGRAWVTAESTLHFAADDPYVAGLPE